MFYKIKNGVVVQKQPYHEAGFIQGPDHVVCGWLYNGGEFSAPEVPDVAPPVSELDALKSALKQKGVISDADIAAARAEEALKK